MKIEAFGKHEETVIALLNKLITERRKVV